MKTIPKADQTVPEAKWRKQIRKKHFWKEKYKDIFIWKTNCIFLALYSKTII